jgi:MFS family permease
MVPQPGGIWRNRNYRLIWSAATVSSFGTQITLLALPLLAAVSLNASPLEMGILAAAQNSAVPVFGLFAGVLADRRSRKPLLIVADLGRALLLLTIPLAWWAGVLSLPLLVVISFISGGFGVLFDVTHQAVVPGIVRRDELVEANGKVFLSESAAELSGPGISGLLVQVIGAPLAILLDALSYLVSGLTLARLKLAEALPHPVGAGYRSVRKEIGEGFRAFMAIPILRTMSFSVAAGNLFENARSAILVLFMTRELEFSPALVGIIYAIGGAGFFVGALLPGWVARRAGLGRAIVIGLLLLWVGDLLFPFAGGPKPLAVAVLAAAMFIFGFGGSIFDVNQFSLRQAVTPDHVRGRVNATIRVMIRGIAPVGALIGGLIAEFAGLRAALIFAAFSSPASLLILYRSVIPGLASVPKPEPLDDR